MKFRQHIILLLLILTIGSYFNDLFSQKTKSVPTRQSSFEAFSKGNYEQAYKEFSQLLLTYSKDPLYKYYSGVCLIKLNRNPEDALALLQQALQNASVVKSLPSDALFYLGRAQQMSGKFTEAIGSYNLYTKQVGKKAARELGVSEYIQQCNDKKGEVTETDIKPSAIVINDKAQVNQIENMPLVKDVIPPSVKKDTSAQVNLPAGYVKILEQALVLQFNADSLTSIANEQKKESDKLPNAQKADLKLKISEIELLAASYQKSADQKYSEAQVIMNPREERIPQKEIVQFTDRSNIKDTLKQSRFPVVETIEKQSENKSSIVIDKQSDTIKKVGTAVIKPVETFSFFEVIAKPAYNPDEKIIIDPEIPAGLIYRIQIAVFRNPVAPSYFKGITPVYGFKIAGTDKTNYYAGMFRRSSDANKALAIVKAKGFKDAFVVALSGNKTVSSDRSAILEKEWGKKPFIKIMKPDSETPIDTIPPTLTFRVEVLRSLTPVKDDIIEGIKKMVGSRGMDTKSLDDGNIVYLIGKFITFESAAEYADLLIRNGYREARVVAWLGKKEIPVETARQLFENME